MFDEARDTEWSIEFFRRKTKSIYEETLKGREFDESLLIVARF